MTDGEKWLFRHVPYYAGWYRFLQFWNSADRMYPAFRVDPEWETPDVSISRANEKMRRIVTTHLQHELAATPELVDQVMPDYPPLGKRMLQDNGWFRALQRDNVTLVNDRISRVTEHIGRHVGRRRIRRRHHHLRHRLPPQQVPVADRHPRARRAPP